MTKETKTIKELKKVNHKLKHQYDLLQIRHCALNSNYELAKAEKEDLIEQLAEVYEEKIDKSVDKIKDYLCSYDYTSAEFKNIAQVFIDLLDILKGVDKE